MNSSKTRLSEFPVVFMSYDEENADENFHHLLNLVPWATRVHGVEGSDNAHKAAAETVGDAERFITVDADNRVDEKFFDMVYDFESARFKDKVLSWAAVNEINGLQYGNGGLKCWPTQYVKDMKTHENATDPRAKVDFCWEDRYVQMTNAYCRTYQNASPRMAFRAGFREGCKLALDRGEKVHPSKFLSQVWHGNIRRLCVWMSVGQHVANGIFAILGARLGFYKTIATDWDFIQVRDFTYLNHELWEKEVVPRIAMPKSEFCSLEFSENLAREWCEELGELIRSEVTLNFHLLDAQSSSFYVATAPYIPNLAHTATEEATQRLIKDLS